jgi:hypothetical protein
MSYELNGEQPNDGTAPAPMSTGWRLSAFICVYLWLYRSSTNGEQEQEHESEHEGT